MAAALLNYAAGRIGQTVDFSRQHALSGTATTKQLQQTLGSVTPDDILIIHNANPVYSMPGAAEHIRRARTVVYLGTYRDETAELATWILPIDSPFESWGDYEPWTGVHGLIQPVTPRLHDTRATGDILLALAEVGGQPLSSDGAFEEWLRNRWDGIRKGTAASTSSADFWTESLRAGGAWEECPAVSVSLRASAVDLKAALLPARVPEAKTETLQLWAWPSVLLFDGRVSNRGWLQETPDPISSMVWGNYIDLHPAKARELGVSDGDIVELRTRAGKIELPVRITDDVVENVAAVAFGQGHTAVGTNATGRGANVFELLGEENRLAMFDVVSLRKTGRRDEMVCAFATQDQHERHLLQWIALSEAARMKPGDGRARDSSSARGIRSPAGHLSPALLQGSSLGHGHRPAALHRLRGLYGGLLCREQYSRHGQGADRQRPANGVAEGRTVSE